MRTPTLWILVALVVFASAVPAVAARPDPATQATMARLYTSLQTLLPLSVDALAFQSPDNAARVGEALEQLAANAEVLRGHGTARVDEATFDQLGRNLANDAREAKRRFVWGQPLGAAHIVREMTEYCVGCHSRLPATPSPLATGFVDAGRLSALLPHERATVHVATRRFDEALDEFEAAFSSKDVPARLLLAPISDYLAVALRVRGDPARAIRAMESLEKRGDLWAQLRYDVGAWRTYLRKVGNRVKGKPSVADAERLIDKGDRLSLHPGGRQGLVHWVVASSLLHRALDRQGLRNAQRAKALYLLGIAEARIRESYWVSSAELYFERAIRVAPHTATARAAYLALEEELIVGAVGVDGMLPAPMRAWLEELRALAGPKS